MGWVCDADGRVNAYRAYEIDMATLILVRPDGYIGLIAERSSVDRVCDHLRLVAPSVVHTAR